VDLIQEEVLLKLINKQENIKKRDILPHETVWAQYEKIFTQSHSLVSEDYKKYLLKYTQEVYPNEYDESYVRVWTKPVTSYAKNYSKFDVSLAPIKNTYVQ
jgi:hypothetical protein